MTTSTRSQEATTTPYIGQGTPRYDGLAKATGAARYTFDVMLPDMVYGAIVSATIPHGRVTQVDHRRAEAVPGVLLVLSVENQAPTPALKAGVKPYVWFNREITHDGQDVAFVVATTQQIADEAATLIDVTYTREPFVATLQDALVEGAPQAGDTPNVEDPGGDAFYQRGDVAAGLAAAAVTIDATYDLAPETHNPLETHVSVAAWDGDQLTLYDSTQWILNTRKTIAAALGVSESNVRVISEHIGGGFGTKLFMKSQAPLAALAARQLQRPVRAQLSRAQMNRNATHRPATLHHLRLGADAAGHLTAIEHENWSANAPGRTNYEEAAATSRVVYACPNVISRHWRVRVNQNPAGPMRAPGDMQSQFALETALDELASALALDPIELRLRNDTPVDPLNGKPYSSKHLRECLLQGAERIGWPQRAAPPGSRRDGPLRRGIGVATAYYPLNMWDADARVQLTPDGAILVTSGAVDIGTGTYTILAQVAADGLGARLEDITMQIGDSTLPKAPLAGGSMMASSVSPAIAAAATDARTNLIAAALALPDGPFVGCVPDDLTTIASGVCLRADTSRALSFADVLRLGNQETIVGTGSWKPQKDNAHALANFGACFAEVVVDVETGVVTVPRFVAVHDSGRVLNANTFRSQIYGGIIWGISAALLEETLIDRRTGRVMNANLTDYLIPTAPDIGDLDVTWIDEPDFHANPLGMKSIGEAGITGVAPAIGNAIYNATGVRLRAMPFKPHRVLTALLEAGAASPSTPFSISDGEAV